MVVDLFTDQCSLTCKNLFGLEHSKRGIVAVASAGENLDTSQLYDFDYLDWKHTVFEKIKEGFDTLNRINEAYVDDKGTPFQNIRIKHTNILDDHDDWVPTDEQLGVREEKEAHESLGDVPYAEIKPRDNVLWVCNLNPITQDEDLYTIFSRFGTVTCTEIIRDRQTGDSHCYGFIEFEDNEACEQAYSRMDNALIDDRRIHVVFSQSVAKSWSRSRFKL